jgi:hypothetical protein
MTKKLISIVYRAFGDGDIAMTKPYFYETTESDEVLCEMVFHQTNTYQGDLWDAIELPADRTHTALSVGDSVIIDGTEWTCEDIGFTKRESGHIQPVA